MCQSQSLSHYSKSTTARRNRNSSQKNKSKLGIHRPTFIPGCQNNEFFSAHYNFVEFNTALNYTKDESSPSLDGIDFKIIKNLPIKYKLILLDLYNEMQDTGIYPESWKKSYIHFIPKSDRKGVRPIALTSCLCELFEHLIKSKLQWWCEYHQIIPKNQSGFRRGKSCTDNLVNLTLEVDHALFMKKETYAAFLDIKGAFDNVQCDILLGKLAEIGCSTNILQFVKFLTHERQIHADCLWKKIKILFSNYNMISMFLKYKGNQTLSTYFENIVSKVHSIE